MPLVRWLHAVGAPVHARCVRHVDVGQVADIVLLDEAPEGRVRRAERDGVLVRVRVRVRVGVGVRGRGRVWVRVRS